MLTSNGAPRAKDGLPVTTKWCCMDLSMAISWIYADRWDWVISWQVRIFKNSTTLTQWRGKVWKIWQSSYDWSFFMNYRSELWISVPDSTGGYANTRILGVLINITMCAPSRRAQTRMRDPTRTHYWVIISIACGQSPSIDVVTKPVDALASSRAQSLRTPRAGKAVNRATSEKTWMKIIFTTIFRWWTIEYY